MKTVAKWLLAILAFASLSAGSAYLGWSGKPETDYIVVPEEVRVEVPEEYKKQLTVGVYADGSVVPFVEESELAQEGLQYIVELYFDIGDGPLVELFLYLPAGGDEYHVLTIQVPTDNYRMKITRKFTIPADQEDSF